MLQMKTIQIKDKCFGLYIPEEQLKEQVQRVAAEISRDFEGKNPIFFPVLTGSVMFATDLFRALAWDAEFQFVKYTSYEGVKSTGDVKKLIGFPDSVKGRHVIIVEDIVETGISMNYMLQELKALEPASISVCTFFHKPQCFNNSFKIDYIGMNIEDDFIVGYGLDYDGLGRMYKDVYQLIQK